MKGFIENTEGITVKNEDFRRVLYTARNCQLVVHHIRAEAEADYAPRLSAQQSWSRARR